MTRINLQGATKLPLVEVQKTDGIGELIIVETPHKGQVKIDYKEETGWITKTNKDKIFGEVLGEIQKLEYEAKEYLLQEWLNKNA